MSEKMFEPMQPLPDRNMLGPMRQTPGQKMNEYFTREEQLNNQFAAKGGDSREGDAYGKVEGVLNNLYHHFMVPVGQDLHNAYTNVVKSGRAAFNEAAKTAQAVESGAKKATGEAAKTASSMVSTFKGILGDVDESMGGGLEHVINDLASQAKGLYPAFASQIDQGLTPRLLSEPYRQMAKQVLGYHVEPNFMSEPKWIRALQGTFDEKANRVTPMPLHEWRNLMMNDRQYGWENTPQAHEVINRMLQGLAQETGLKLPGGNR